MITVKDFITSNPEAKLEHIELRNKRFIFHVSWPFYDPDDDPLSKYRRLIGYKYIKITAKTEYLKP